MPEYIVIDWRRRRIDIVTPVLSRAQERVLALCENDLSAATLTAVLGQHDGTTR